MLERQPYHQQRKLYHEKTPLVPDLINSRGRRLLPLEMDVGQQCSFGHFPKEAKRLAHGMSHPLGLGMVNGLRTSMSAIDVLVLVLGCVVGTSFLESTLGHC